MLNRRPSPTSLALSLLACLDVTSAHYAITGVHTGVNTQTGVRPARRDILELQNDIPSWFDYSLFTTI